MPGFGGDVVFAFVGSFVSHVVAKFVGLCDELFEELESLPLFVSWITTNTMAIGIRSREKFRIDRFRLCFLSASNWAIRRASRFWRWRSRFSELGTAGESTDALSGERIAGALRYDGRS
jgi:hypothetical protein